ncbi:nuclear transport factor 2 family protein [Rhodococcus pyridinivorans]|uniref:nuclear transport factor 2 family protein n=1 Tax=Rhodococcus pyridinivorans TaxID=103816 RepID=UPI0020784DCF|nr:nuclear transport factor 2 family protein [Rhodococcus pyridinivorans]USI92995.1 nuclear transport factor 2 family protein [Rhodococcus pyridinivorans]
MIGGDDWSEVQHLQAQFGRALDTGDFEALREIFTADVEYTSGGSTKSGIDALVASFVGRASAPRTTRHLPGPPVVVAHTGDAIDTVLTCVAWAAHSKPVAQTAEVYMVADFHDTYRRTPKGWRISARRIVPVLRNAALAPRPVGAPA